MFLIGSIIIAILVFMLISIHFDNDRPFFRLVEAGDKFIIQYRYMFFRWKTYTLASGEPAVYYIKTEAEDMIKTLVDRRKVTKNLDKLAAKSVKIHNYSASGQFMNKE